MERPAWTQIAARPRSSGQIHLLIHDRDQFHHGQLESEHGGVHGQPADGHAGRRRRDIRQLFLIHIGHMLRSTENPEDHDPGCRLSQHHTLR